MSSESNRSAFLAFIAGVATGTAIGLYLNSDAGRENRALLNNKAKELEQEYSAKMKTQLDSLSSNVTTMIDDTQKKVEAKMAEIKKSATDGVKSATDSVKSAREKLTAANNEFEAEL